MKRLSQTSRLEGVHGERPPADWIVARRLAHVWFVSVAMASCDAGGSRTFEAMLCHLTTTVESFQISGEPVSDGDFSVTCECVSEKILTVIFRVKHGIQALADHCRARLRERYGGEGRSGITEDVLRMLESSCDEISGICWSFAVPMNRDEVREYPIGDRGGPECRVWVHGLGREAIFSYEPMFLAKTGQVTSRLSADGRVSLAFDASFASNPEYFEYLDPFGLSSWTIAFSGRCQGSGEAREINVVGCSAVLEDWLPNSGKVPPPLEVCAAQGGE